MRDALLVGRRQGVGDRDRDRKKALQGHATVWNVARQVLAVDQLHGQEVEVSVFLDRVHGDDVGVTERGDRPCLAPEALETPGVVRHLGSEDLERHPPAELAVLGDVNLTHATLAELLDDAEVQQLPAACQLTGRRQLARQPTVVSDAVEQRLEQLWTIATQIGRVRGDAAQHIFFDIALEQLANPISCRLGAQSSSRILNVSAAMARANSIRLASGLLPSR